MKNRETVNKEKLIAKCFIVDFFKMSGTYYFMLLGRGDWPLYEMEYVVPPKYSGNATLASNQNSASSSSLQSMPGVTLVSDLQQQSIHTAQQLAQQMQQKQKDDRRHSNQLIAHAALDVLDELSWQSTNNYLKVVDRFQEWMVSAYVTPGSARMLMVHDVKNDDGIGKFFADVYECYTKHILNPFYSCNTSIRSQAFDKRIEYLCHKFLT